LEGLLEGEVVGMSLTADVNASGIDRDPVPCVIIAAT
jgi:hypothetical protein